MVGNVIKLVIFSALALFVTFISILLMNDWMQLRQEREVLQTKIDEMALKTNELIAAQEVARGSLKQIEADSKHLLNWALKHKKLPPAFHELSKELSQVNDDNDSRYPSAMRTMEKGGHYSSVIKSLEAAKVDVEEHVSELRKLSQTLVAGTKIADAIPSIMPTDGWISSTYGMRKSPFNGRLKMHKGVDVAAYEGAKVVSTADGVVTFIGRKGGYGKLVVVDHGFGISTRYGHSKKILVKEGERVKRGQAIATIGMTGNTTGAHVHYEVSINDRHVNPWRFLKLDGKPVTETAIAEHAEDLDQVLPMGGDEESFAGVPVDVNMSQIEKLSIEPSSNPIFLDSFVEYFKGIYRVLFILGLVLTAVVMFLVYRLIYTLTGPGLVAMIDRFFSKRSDVTVDEPATFWK